MHDLGDLLVHAGFADPVMDQEQLTLTWSRRRLPCRNCARSGGNLHAGTPRRACARRAGATRLLARLRERRDADGRIALSFEIVYGHAFDRVPRARVAPVSHGVAGRPARRLARQRSTN